MLPASLRLVGETLDGGSDLTEAIYGIEEEGIEKQREFLTELLDFFQSNVAALLNGFRLLTTIEQSNFTCYG
jgi:hypothetical protein